VRRPENVIDRAGQCQDIYYVSSVAKPRSYCVLGRFSSSLGGMAVCGRPVRGVVSGSFHVGGMKSFLSAIWSRVSSVPSVPAARLGNARDGETGYGTRCVRTAIIWCYGSFDPWQQAIVFAKPARVAIVGAVMV